MLDAKKEMQVLIDFAEEQFEGVGREVCFKALQPKVYQHPEKYLQHHKVYYENGEIRGMYVVYPTAFKGLSFKGIGTLCISAKYRGQGLMSQMFEDILKENEDTDIFYLSGDKARYEHFGFYISGKKLEFRIKKRSLATNFPLFKMEKYAQNDIDVNKRLYEIYTGCVNYMDRDVDDYYDILRTKGYDTYIFRESNQIVSYIVYNAKENLIIELACAPKYTKQSLSSFVALMELEDINIELGINSPRKFEIYKVAETYKSSSITNIRVNNYCKVIQRLLSEKENLLHGKLVIAGFIEENIAIEVGEEIKVSKTIDDADIIVQGEDVNLLLFSDYLAFLPTAKMDLIASWFPLILPITIKTIDSI